MCHFFSLDILRVFFFDILHIKKTCFNLIFHILFFLNYFIFEILFNFKNFILFGIILYLRYYFTFITFINSEYS